MYKRYYYSNCATVCKIYIFFKKHTQVDFSVHKHNMIPICLMIHKI